jgi:hypothetical protein
MKKGFAIRIPIDLILAEVVQMRRAAILSVQTQELSVSQSISWYSA